MILNITPANKLLFRPIKSGDVWFNLWCVPGNTGVPSAKGDGSEAKENPPGGQLLCHAPLCSSFPAYILHSVKRGVALIAALRGFLVSSLASLSHAEAKELLTREKLPLVDFTTCLFFHKVLPIHSGSISQLPSDPETS